MAGRAEQGGRPGPKGKAARGCEAPPDVSAKVEAEIQELQMRSVRLWGPAPRPTRGSKPGLSREEIVGAAIALADQEGLQALTMHAVAKRLGFTTMALYRYFPNKEGLIDACVDTAMGKPPEGGDPGEGWRQRVVRWAYAKRAMMCARPWLAELPFVAAPHGPNWMSWHEALLQALDGTGLCPEDMMEMLSVVHAYVTGASDTAISLAKAMARGVTPAQWAMAVGADLGRAIGDPRYPVFSGILTSQSGGISEDSPLPARGGRPRTMDECFDFGLQRVLDGIEAYVEKG